jgi:excisionase family DNA binding protein
MVSEKKLGPLMTVRDVARLLNIHNNTVRRWSDRGMIKAYRINDRGDRRFKRDEIVRFLSELSMR